MPITALHNLEILPFFKGRSSSVASYLLSPPSTPNNLRWSYFLFMWSYILLRWSYSLFSWSYVSFRWSYSLNSVGSFLFSWIYFLFSWIYFLFRWSDFLFSDQSRIIQDLYTLIKKRLRSMIFQVMNIKDVSQYWDRVIHKNNNIG